MSRAPFDFPPGEAMIYNNSAFILLGHIIEKVSGMSYEDYVEQKIFAPLGMKSSRYCKNSETVALRARGYVVAQQGTRLGEPNDHTWPFSAGSLCSTAGDLVTWMKALHGGKVLSDRSYREMTSQSKLKDGTPIRYGMGISVGPDMRGARMIGHGGAITGFTADARWYPDANLYVAVLFNSAGPVSASSLAGDLAGAVIPPVNGPPRPYTGDVAPMIGKYAGPSRGRPTTVEVTRVPQGIAISVNGSPARPIGWMKDLTFIQGDLRLTFDRVANGKAALLRFDAPGGYYMLKRE
jgi:CubicO group peptidase (beta-lactamase class C family)